MYTQEREGTDRHFLLDGDLKNSTRMTIRARASVRKGAIDICPGLLPVDFLSLLRTDGKNARFILTSPASGIELKHAIFIH